MSKKSNNQILKEYLDKYDLPYKIINFDNKDIIEIDLANIPFEHHNNLFKDINNE